MAPQQLREAEAVQCSASVAELYQSLADISANISYVQAHLRDGHLPDSIRLQVAERCEEFEGAIYDVRVEIRNLNDKLGMYPGQPPLDADIRNPDPRVSMRFIADWLATEVNAMHETVLRLQEASKLSPDCGRAYLLVAESATNILRAFAQVQSALATIEAKLAPARTWPPS